MPTTTLNGDETFDTTGTYNDATYTVSGQATVPVADASVVIAGGAPVTASFSQATLTGCSTRPAFLHTPTGITSGTPNDTLDDDSGSGNPAGLSNWYGGTALSASGENNQITSGRLAVDTSGITGSGADATVWAEAEQLLVTLSAVEADFTRLGSRVESWPGWETYDGPTSVLMDAGWNNYPNYMAVGVTLDYTGAGNILHIVYDGTNTGNEVVAVFDQGYTADDTSTYQVETWAKAAGGTDEIRIEIVGGDIQITVNGVAKTIAPPDTAMAGPNVEATAIDFARFFAMASNADISANPWEQSIQVANMKGEP